MSFKAKLCSPAFLTALFLLVYAALMFRTVWPVDQVIQSSDYNYGLMGQYKAELPGSFFDGFWRGSPLLGRAGHAAPTWTFLALTVLPLDVYMDWIYAINLLLASGFLLAFLRARGLSWLPATAGALTAFWLGSNLTLLYPGHLEKYGVLVFASATLYCLEQTLQKTSWRWAALSGASLGWMFMHQADLALFFGIVLGAYWLFGLVTRLDGAWPKRLALHVPMLLLAGLFVWESYETSMRTQVRNVDILQEGSPEEKWEFITQWSFPPAESMDLVAPGFWGWMTGHPEAPYHGRTGEAPGWQDKQPGSFPNLKTESVYLGLLPFFFAALALAGGRKRKAELAFWSAALLITFLLACGKYFPLYHFFTQLPLVQAIRNPNKFLQVFQWILGILCAFGLQQLLSDSFADTPRKKAATLLIFISLVAGGSSLLTRPDSAGQQAPFSQSPWAGQAEGILRNRQLALLHLSLISAAGGGLVFASASGRFRRPAAAGLVLLLAGDALLLSRVYLQSTHTRFVKENRVAEFLKPQLGAQRVAVVDTRGLYNLYLTHVFPYHHIAFANITAAPRLSPDFKNYLAETRQDPIRYWQEFGVKYVLLPRQISDAVLRNPGMDQVLKEVYSYDIAAHPRGGVRTAPGKPGESGNHVILELQLPSERFALLPVDSGNPDRDLREGIRGGQVLNVLQSRNRALLQTEVGEQGALLRLADEPHPQLRARFDGGEPVALKKTGRLFAGVEVPAGTHEIELSVTPPGFGTRAQWAGLLIGLLIALSFLLRGAETKDK